jgi:hypothetical protein
MKNNVIISLFINFLLGILFVFPVYSAQSFNTNKIGLEVIAFYGNDREDDENKSNKNKLNRSKDSYSRYFQYLKSTTNYFYITNFICESDICAEFSLKYSQQIVDISFLRSLRSIVMLC